jgi:hypothetical protein
MPDIDALLNSLVNIDRNSLLAILSSEAEAARQLVNTARQRTASQRAKRRDAEQRAARVERMLSFFQHGDTVPGMSPRVSSSVKLSNKGFVRGANRQTRPLLASNPNGIVCGRRGRCNASTTYFGSGDTDRRVSLGQSPRRWLWR